ncbi:cytochrome P450 [Infundibulicybe gibba]|nr:cytochrome P450 [Infundibulicybe gibba]
MSPFHHGLPPPPPRFPRRTRPCLPPLSLLLLRQRSSPLRRLPGPPPSSFFLGNLPEMHDQENTNLLHTWEQKYGPAFVYRGFVGGCRLMLTDPVAVAHILTHAYDYPKPDFVRDSLATMAAGHDGLLTVEGDVHRKQRKILSPAFSVPHINSLTPIFYNKAYQVSTILLLWACLTPRSCHTPAPTRVDALAHLARATLDVIGLAGFGYTFGCLDTLAYAQEEEEHANELANAFAVIFSTARQFRVFTILQVWFPCLDRRNSKTMLQAQATMRRIGLGLIAERSHGKASQEGADEITGIRTGGRDLLSVLIASNSTEAPRGQMGQEEVLCQMSTFMAAGHETTASAVTWCLYALVRDTQVQSRLRAALRGLVEEGDGPALTERIVRCEYLDWVVRESLRLHAPVTNTMRVCMRDVDEIPVSTEQGEGGYVDNEGVQRWSIRVAKGDIISIPIQAINKSVRLWGPDAAAFRPERWADPPASARTIPGLLTNTLTFLNGTRACIGYKFALIEIKIFLYVLLKDIEFSIDPSTLIEKKVNVVTRPFVTSEPHLGNQMPLYIRRAAPPDCAGVEGM